MIDLKQILEQDPYYVAILKNAKPEERKALEEYLSSFLSAWQNTIINPLEEKITKDEEFRKSIIKELDKTDS